MAQASEYTDRTTAIPRQRLDAGRLLPRFIDQRESGTCRLQTPCTVVRRFFRGLSAAAGRRGFQDSRDTSA